MKVHGSRSETRARGLAQRRAGARTTVPPGSQRRVHGWAAPLGALVAWGCSAPPAPADDAPPSPALAAYVLTELPSDVPNRTFIDFEGKVQLLGWQLEPPGPVAPGSRVKLTLWWRSVQDLPAPFALFTHVLRADGGRVSLPDGKALNADDSGPLRAREGDGPQALGPGRWRPGHVYVDTQEIELPRELATTEITFAVGVWRYFALPGKGGEREVRGLRLAVLSGPTDGQNRALVARAPTTWSPPAQR